MLLRTGKAGPLLKPAQYLHGLLPQSHEPPEISFTTSGRQVGVSCIIKRPVTGLIRTSLLFGTGAFRCAGFRIAPAFPSGERDREVSPGGCGHRDGKVTFRPGPWELPPLERIGWGPRR
jgi:hypothetical protein